MRMATARTDARTPPANRAGGITLVLGMGGTGVSCARFLAATGTRAIFADTRPLPPGLAAIRAAMPRPLCLGARRPGAAGVTGS